MQLYMCRKIVHKVTEWTKLTLWFSQWQLVICRYILTNLMEIHCSRIIYKCDIVILINMIYLNIVLKNYIHNNHRWYKVTKIYCIQNIVAINFKWQFWLIYSHACHEWPAWLCALPGVNNCYTCLAISSTWVITVQVLTNFKAEYMQGGTR